MKKYYHVNVFTTQHMKGNQAGVVLNADGLSSSEMQLIARDLNLPETAFILNPSNKSNDFLMQWFTPDTEVDLCGHSAIAGIHVLIKTGMINLIDGFVTRVNIEYGRGVLPVRISKTENNSHIQIWYQIESPQFKPFGGFQEEIFRYLGITDNDIDSRLPTYISEHRILFIPVLGLLTLKKIEPVFDELRKIMVQENVQGICTFSRETKEPGNSFHSRFFAPTIGINEDAVTGTSNAQLAAYWVEYILGGLKDEHLVLMGEQGDVLGREGQVKINITNQNGKGLLIEVGGAAIIFMEGYLNI